MAAQVLPPGLDGEPPLIDDALAHLCQLPSRFERRGDVLAQKVHVGDDRNGLTRATSEMRWRARGDDEMRVVRHQHKPRLWPREPPCLAVERTQVAQML